jgi:hypothetical protein
MVNQAFALEPPPTPGVEVATERPPGLGWLGAQRVHERPRGLDGPRSAMVATEVC